MNSDRLLRNHWLNRIFSIFWIVAGVIALFLLFRVDLIVHGTLYRYGLVFSYNWANPYWTYTKVVYALLMVSVGLSAFSLVLDFARSWKQSAGSLAEVDVKSSRVMLRTKLNQIIIFAMLTIGVVLVVTSGFYVSSFLAILGVAIVFWGGILLYITPSKHVPLTLLNAASISNISNTERILSEANLTEKGRYLPPKYLRDFESSLVFIPEKPSRPLPKPEDIAEDEPLRPNRGGFFLTPPGLPLSKLFEKELKISFTKTDLNYVQQRLPKLLIENLEIAETAEMQIQNDGITVEITGNILNEVCQETRKLPRTHVSVGCLLSSAIACVLAKATGKAVTIQKEEDSSDGKTTTIQYQIIGE